MSTACYVKSKNTLRRLYGGPLGTYIDELTTVLEGQGYRPQSIYKALHIVSEFSRWLYGRHLNASDVTDERVQRYLRDRARTLAICRGQRTALTKIVRLLQAKGVAETPSNSLDSKDRQHIENVFGEYVLQCRGLSASTLSYYLPFVSQFLKERFPDGCIELNVLGAEDVITFVKRHARDGSHSRVQMLVKGLRTFLRYLRHQGLIKTDLAACVPKVARWSFAALPKFLSTCEVRDVLRCCDRQTKQGRRDYAIVSLLAHLGLRAGEVAAMKLDQIDWAHGCLTVRNKGGQWTPLPIPEEVGQALTDYVMTARPTCADRHVFIRSIAPRLGYTSSGISALATTALARASISSERTGAHIFRHALATEMLRKGGFLSDIGQLLRHKHPDTTRVYAKVDLTALRDLALPWPRGAQ